MILTCTNSYYRADTFRSALGHIGELRSLIPAGVSVMALTATATKYVRQIVSKRLGMRNPSVVTAPPCHLNVKYSVGSFKCIKENFISLVEQLKTEGITMGRVIVYCKRIRIVLICMPSFKRIWAFTFCILLMLQIDLNSDL